jgi:hypothetical protein
MPFCQSQVHGHSAHVGFRTRVAYRWIDVLYEEFRRSERVYVCLLPNDSGMVIPAWMFDPALCACMKLGAPVLSMGALQEARAILTELGSDGSVAAPDARQKERADAKPGTARSDNDATAFAAECGMDEYEKNQERLSRNNFSKPAGAAKAARGGQALMAGILRCGRCGRMLQVLYGGRGIRRPRYNCRRGHAMQGLDPCISFGAQRPDAAVVREILLAVHPPEPEDRMRLDAAGPATQGRHPG